MKKLLSVISVILVMLVVLSSCQPQPATKEDIENASALITLYGASQIYITHYEIEGPLEEGTFQRTLVEDVKIGDSTLTKAIAKLAITGDKQSTSVELAGHVNGGNHSMSASMTHVQGNDPSYSIRIDRKPIDPTTIDVDELFGI